MASIVLHTTDSDLGDRLREAAADCAVAAGEEHQWLTALPDSPADVVDLLIHDARTGEPLDDLLAGTRHRPHLVVLVVDPAALPPDTQTASADELVPWPAGSDLLRNIVALWLARIRSARRTVSAEGRHSKLTRENNELKRQLARHNQHARLREKDSGSMRQILARMEGITRLGQRINSLKLDEVIDLSIQRIPTLLGARLASLFFLDEGKRVLRLQKHNHPYPINATVDLDQQPNSPMAMAVSRQQVLLINDPDWVQKVDPSITRPYAHRYSTGNCVIAPLVSGSRVIGVLNLADKVDGGEFDELIDLVPIRQLAELLAASIRNIELYRRVEEQARTDGMTGLANHSTFVHELGREINRARRYGTPLSLILIDLDSLKWINDQLGHVVGDRALKLVARQIVRTIRDSDVAARYGGDEFGIMLPNTTLDAAHAVAERLIETICDVPLVHDAGSTQITVSIGLGQYDGAHRSPEHFIEQVDAALYRAKNEGKNRIALLS